MLKRGTVRAYHEAISRYGIEAGPDDHTVFSTPHEQEVKLGHVLEWEPAAVGEQVFHNLTTGRDVRVTVLHHAVARADLHERMGGY